MAAVGRAPAGPPHSACRGVENSAVARRSSDPQPQNVRGSCRRSPLEDPTRVQSTPFSLLAGKGRGLAGEIRIPAGRRSGPRRPTHRPLLAEAQAAAEGSPGTARDGLGFDHAPAFGSRRSAGGDSCRPSSLVSFQPNRGGTPTDSWASVGMPSQNTQAERQRSVLGGHAGDRPRQTLIPSPSLATAVPRRA